MEVPLSASEVDDLDELVFDPCPWLCYMKKYQTIAENEDADMKYISL